MSSENQLQQLEPNSTADSIIKAMEENKIDWTTGKKSPEAVQQPEPKPDEKLEQKPTETKPEAKSSDVDAELNELQAKLSKPAPKQEEPKPDEDFLKDEPPKGVAQNTAESWNKFKAKSNAEIRRLQKELEAARKQPAADPEITKQLEVIRKERDELSQSLERASLADHPRFKAHYAQREAQVIEDAKALAGENADRLAAVLALPDTKYKQDQINDIIATLPEASKVQLGAVMVEYRRLHKEKNDALANHRPTLQKFKEQEQQEIARAKEHAERVFDAVVRDASEKLPEWFSQVEGNEEWNAKVSSRINEAKSLLYGNNDPAAISRAALWSVLGKEVASENKMLRRMVELQRQKISELAAAEPSIRSQGNESTPAKEYGSYAEAVAAQASNNGFAQR